jgi:sec-independent protein translocase protein TatB
MFYLFIFESIGTQELILIGIVALMFLGPRKLPEYAKKIGKFMADFRSTTQEFRNTWEKEVNFDEEVNAIRSGEVIDVEPVARIKDDQQTIGKVETPAIKPIDKAKFDELREQNAAKNGEAEAAVNVENNEESHGAHDAASDKRNWL